MSRFLVFAFAFALASGCAKQKEAPPAVVIPPDLPPVQPETPQPGDDGSIPLPRPVPGQSRMLALGLGVDYLLKQQSKDGAWRSDEYATFKDGTALTPLTVTALQEAFDADVHNRALETAIKKGCEFLATLVKDGTVVPPADAFDYPVYTAALTLKAFSHPTAKQFAAHRDAWVTYLKQRQLTEKLGWKPEDKQYGGWGYCHVIPMKPEPGKFAPNLIESNISATVFALDALKAADALDAEMRKAAAIFVRRCQNPYRETPGKPDAEAKPFDGGFHFIYDDPTRNKAGLANANPLCFHSYGSATADGFQALALCNDPADKDCREWARKWLLTNFSADHHPGTYIKTHEPNRDAVYFYYAASVARAFRDHKLTLPGGRDWSDELSVELGRRQAKDGNWANFKELGLVRENDPILATSNAVLALARCK